MAKKIIDKKRHKIVEPEPDFKIKYVPDKRVSIAVYVLVIVFAVLLPILES
jgi:hypothetical protein